jgi:hypothetical protein
MHKISEVLKDRLDECIGLNGQSEIPNEDAPRRLER